MKLRQRIRIIQSALLIFLLACNPAQDQVENKSPKSKEVLLAEVDSLERIIGEAASLSTVEKEMELLLKAYIQSQEIEPESQKAPDFLFRAARIARGLGKYQKAINLYNKILQDYPSYERRPDCMFLKAFILDDDLGMKDKAKEAYHELIAKHPKHRYAKDAQHLLEMLYMTDEELIRSFEEKNKVEAQ